MTNRKEKLFSMLLVGILVISGLGAVVVSSENSNNNGHNDVNISIQSYGNVTDITYNINGFVREDVIIDDEEYIRIILDDESQIMEQGSPDVPNICRSIIIPDDLKMDVEIIGGEYQEFENVLIAPSKGNLPRTVNPDDVPYTFGDAYSEDEWFPGEIAELRDPYILRDFRGQVVIINPFQYNPVQKTLRVYNELNIQITPVDLGEINVFDRTQPLTRLDIDFNSIYEHHFINYDTNCKDRYTAVEEQGNMLVICYDSFYSTMVPFVEWKNMKGIPTEIVNVSSIGSGSANDIDTFIDTYYNTNGLTFALLVGDIAQIPSLTYSGHASDPSYAFIVGSDNYQDIFIGRFSAQNIVQLDTQVNRSIEYEKYPQVSADWYHKGLGVASNQGTGDDGEYDDEHVDIIRGKLLNFTYTDVGQSYDPTGTSTIIANFINGGTSIINYCGHGGPTSWSNGGGFSNSDVNALVNDNMLPYIISVACNTGEFENYDTCFAEAWMRATNNAEPTGAIGIFASTQSQSWDPPMDAQDESVDLLVNYSMFSIGGLSYCGTMHMMDEYGSTCYDETNTWTLFGDPSLMIMTDTPSTMTVDHNPGIMTGSTEFEVTVSNIEGALCAISYNGMLLGCNYTDSSGEAFIELTDPVEDMDQVDLVVTSFNMMPYMVALDVSPPIRQPAEFEPMEAVLIRYPFGISYDIIAEMAENVTVITIVASSGDQSYVELQYTSHGVNTANCEYLIASSDTYWTRDYGPWFKFNATTNLLEVVDFNYNRPRPNDNAIPQVFATAEGLNYSYMSLTHTGGNYMTDGKGISISTDLVYSENPGMTPDEINQTVRDYLGIQTYHAYVDPLGAYIEHVDCWGKYLSPDTIMITEVPVGHSQYDEYEAAVNYFESQFSCYGVPYNVVRVYAPNGEPYTNSLILNDKVLVPQTGSQWDDDAIASYEAVMPGYEVLGFTGSWVTTDALHCRTKGIPDRDMIYIDHDPLNNQMPDDAGFIVEAEIISYGSSRDVLSPEIHWKNTTGGWGTASMSSDEDTYSAFIPNHACGETLSYYISAENSEGDMFNEPFIGEDDPFWFNVTLVPDIWVDPLSIQLWGNEGEIITEDLTIGNDDFAGENLDFDLTCTDSGGYGWLSVDITNGSLPPATSVNISVMADATGLNVGIYSESIHISSDDPDTPMMTIPIELEIVYADNVGAVSVNYPTGQQLPGTHAVNATVENFGSEANTFSVNCSIYEGGGEMIEDFEDDNGGYTHDQGPGPGSIDDWEWGTPTYGPSSAHSGSNCWATNLDGDHSNSADSVLDSISIDLNMYSPTPQLKFWHWYDHTTYDCGNVKISTDGGASWSIIYPDSGYTGTATSGNQGIPGEPAFTDVSSGWEQVRFNLSAYEGETVMFRWHFGSTSSTTHPGWYIDDVAVSSSLTRDPGDIVYSSIETISLPAYSSGFVEFSPPWDVSNLSFYAIKVKTELAGDEDVSNDESIGVVEISSAPAGHITLLAENWNFVSLPFNQSISKSNLLVNYDASNHGWSEAVSDGYVNDVVFGWDRVGQSYNFANTFIPGDGYWIYAYQNCELKAPVFEVNFDGRITDVMEDWNVIGMPNNVPMNKSNVTVNYAGTDYSWSDAVSSGYINDFIFGWDSSTQGYSFSSTLDPGYAYWLYAYQQCTLKRVV